ncbi:MAG: ABC transporter ATP-binding protein [Acidobacteriota bacterium]
MSTLAAVSWPIARADEALRELARHADLLEREGPVPVRRAPSSGKLTSWLEEAGRRLGLEVEAVAFRHGEIDDLLTGSAPAVLRHTLDGEPALLVLLRSDRRQLLVLDPELRQRRVPAGLLRESWQQELLGDGGGDVEALLDAAGTTNRRRGVVRDALLSQRLRDRRLSNCWLLRPQPGSSPGRQLTRAGVVGQLGELVLWHLLYSATFLGSWWLIGRGALSGRIEPGWFSAWILSLLTLLPLRVLASWTQARLSVTAGVLLRRRLLQGSLRLHPDEVRHQGVGRQLGRVLESQALEQLALNGGFLALFSGLELVLAGLVLAAGAAGPWHVGLLLAWLILTGWLTLSLHRRRHRWTEQRLRMTQDLVEKLLGHRTRLVQQSPERWHEDEDPALATYLALGSSLDASTARLRALVARGFGALGVLALAPALFAGDASLPALAVSVGGLLFAGQAFAKLTTSAGQLSGAWIAWQEIRDLFHAAARTGEEGNAAVDPSRPSPATSELADDESEVSTPRVLDVRNLGFRHAGRTEPVLRDCQLRVELGERWLLHGASGGGKSTLASLVLGLRKPSSGLVLSRGLDLSTVGDHGWRRRIAGVPQFHENFVLGETFAFNLLFGRAWPPTREDMREAHRTCEALGLGELLRRMPGGLMQRIGETGWQLSHGEMSRLFLARALLQEGDLLVLDESFAALDPDNLQRALAEVTRRPSAVLLIAHA